MAETPFIKFFPSDFLAGVSGLSPAERGVYITILSLIWDNDGPITMDEGRLARRCGGPKATVKKIVDTLIDEGKLTRTSEGLTNRRAENALSDRQSRVKNAKRAARDRWTAQRGKTQQNQTPSDATAYATAMPPDMRGECHSRVQSPEDDDDAGARDLPDDLFPDGGNASAITDGVRERILEAIGADPTSGIVGPNGTMLGTASDMLEFTKWKSDLALTDDQISDVVADVMARNRNAGRGPPKSFRYFTDAMAEFAAARDRPMPQPDPARGGHRNGKSSFTADIHDLSQRLSSGEVELSTASRDPWSVRPGGDDGADYPDDDAGQL